MMINRLADMMGDDSLIGLYDSTEALTSEIIHFLLYGIMSRKEGGPCSG